MKKVQLFSLFIFALICFSCGSDKKDEKKETALDNSTAENFQIEVSFKSNLNDRFKVYYAVGLNSEIDYSLLLTKNTYASDEMQTIVFNFPKGVVPSKLRLDVGENQNANEITIKNITEKYKNSIVDGDDGEFVKYWVPTDCLTYDTNNFVYKIFPANGKKTPIFISNLELNKKLRSFISKKND